jgi:hypothetical protein
MFNQKEYNKKYQLENKERIKELQDEYYAKHREERIKNARQWYLNNREKALATRRKAMKTPLGRLLSIRSSAKTRGIEYLLLDDEAIEIMSSPCFYCGKDVPTGIDRVDSSIGYTNDNSVSCCSMCNYMKRTYEKEEFIEQCRLISRNHS